MASFSHNSKLTNVPITTGNEPIDRLLEGGLNKSELNVVCGQNIPSTKDIIKQLLMDTPIETRLKVSIEMTFINLLVELGFIEDRHWSDSDEDNRILGTIVKAAEKESKYLAKQVKKWQADGMP